MANPLYGQNKNDDDMSLYGRGKMEIITTTAAHTLVADNSGALIFANVAAAELTLPSAEAGLHFYYMVGIDATAGSTIVAASGDCFFGQIRLISTTEEQTEVQDVDHATAIATVTSYDNFDLVSNSASLGGTSGDVIHLIAVDSTAWLASCTLTTVHANPAGVAVINAG